MGKKVKPNDLGAAIASELTVYHKDVTERVNECGRKAIKKLVNLTKADAPQGVRGSFKRSITSTEVDAGHDMKAFFWHVKGPDARLTHLLAHGHATRDGGRTRSDPFLANALDQVLPEYEHDIEEAVQRND